MSYMIPPSDNLSPNQLFDPFCVNDRVKHLKNLIIEILLEQDLKAWALEHKKRFEEIPQYPFNPEEKFGKQAEQEAWKIIEAERKLLAQRLSPYIKTKCNLAISQLNNIVWTIDEKGKPTKHKWYVEEVPNILSHNKESPPTMEIQYVGDHDFITLERINHIFDQLNEFREIIPYCDDETKQLYGKALELGSLERVEIRGKRNNAKEEKET